MSRPDIPVTISGDEKGFRAAMARVRGVAGSTARDVGAAFMRVKGAAGALPAFLAAAGLTTVVTAARDAAAAVASVGDEAKRAGLSAKAFQELKFVAEQNRIGVDQLTDGIKELNLRADEFITTGGGSAADAFKRLGYSAEDLKGKLKDPSALFSEIIGRLGQFNKAAQIRISDEMFGGSAGERFVELIGQGEAGIRKTIQASNDLGIVMSDELIAKAAEVDRQFNVVATTVGTTLKSAIVSAASSLMQFIDGFRQFEDQKNATLEGRQIEIGTRRLEIENEILQKQQDQRDNLQQLSDVAKDLGFEASQNEALAGYTGQIAALKREMKELGEEDAKITGILNNRIKSTPTLTNATWTPPHVDSSRGGKARGGADKEAEAIKRVIEALQGEIEVIGLSAVEREKLQALREAGVTAASKEGQQISALVEAKHRELAAEEALIDARERAQEAAENFGAVLDDQLDRIIDGTFEAKDALAALAKELANAVTGGKGLFSGLLSQLFGSGNASSFVPTTTLGDFLGFGGGRAGGGGVSPGRLYEVNEREQEFFIPKVHGDVVPASKLGGDPVSVTYAPVYNFTGTADEIVKIKQQAAQDRTDFEARTILAVRKAQKRRLL